jgi:inorganic pyrophosphatase
MKFKNIANYNERVKMKCAFCKRDENEIKSAITPVINNLQRQIKKLENEVKDIRENYAERKGFTSENFKKVKVINEKYLKMKMSAFLLNKFKIIEIEPNSELLLNYYYNYKPSINRHVDTLNDLMNVYLEEPTKERLDMEIEKITGLNKKIRDMNNMLANNRIYHGYFSKEINFPFYGVKDQFDYIDIALCPHCLTLFNISIADAIKAESEMENCKIIEKESFQRAHPVPRFILVGNKWLPGKCKS